jgi:hypothetical protein
MMYSLPAKGKPRPGSTNATDHGAGRAPASEREYKVPLVTEEPELTTEDAEGLRPVSCLRLLGLSVVVVSDRC